MVMDIVEHLLLEGDFESSEDVSEIEVTNVCRVQIENQEKFEGRYWFEKFFISISCLCDMRYDIEDVMLYKNF